MNSQNKKLYMPTLDKVVEKLCEPSSYQAVSYQSTCNDSAMLSKENLAELVSRLRSVFFPGYFDAKRFPLESMRYHLSANLDSIYRGLSEQIVRSLCFNCEACKVDETDAELKSKADSLAMQFVDALPQIRHLLATDVQAAYEGDPAASMPAETILCYPSIKVMMHHRIAHELYRLKVPFIPRIISEVAHSETGIDIHPGAQIGEEFFIDHGTGVVIGETSIIGKKCRLYQGVTLGALSFPKDADGSLIKGVPRHPILEDNVTVYAGATILGRITIGSGSVIGGNTWVTQSVAAGSKVLQTRYTSEK